MTSPGAEQLPFVGEVLAEDAADDLARVDREPQLSTSGAAGARQALDVDAGAVVAVDAHVVQRERPRLACRPGAPWRAVSSATP